MRLHYWRGGQRTMTSGGQTLLVLALSVVIVLGQLADAALAQPSQPEPAKDHSSRPSATRQPTATAATAAAAAATTPAAPAAADEDDDDDDLAGNRDMHKIKPTPQVIRAFEQSLLKMFGLRSRPRPTRKVHIPQYMLDLYHRRARGTDGPNDIFDIHGQNTYTANTIRSFLHSEDEENRRHQGDIGSGHHTRRFYFNTSGLTSEEKLRVAEFRIYRQAIVSNTSKTDNHVSRAQQNSDNNTDSDSTLQSHAQQQRSQQEHPVNSRKYSKQRIDIYEVLRPATRTREAITRLLDTRVVDSSQTMWESFDVRPAVARWREGAHRNHGLEVRVRSAEPHIELRNTDTPHVRLRRSVADRDEQQWQATQPQLVTYSDDGTSKVRSRRKRGSGKRKRSRSYSKKIRKGECRRHQLYVDFGDVGWDDWIVAPVGYDAYYCHGECNFPLPEHMNTTNHAIVQTLVHSVNQKFVPRPCCVPTELSSISMLYLDETQKVVLKTYQDMVVVGCGCR